MLVSEYAVRARPDSPVRDAPHYHPPPQAQDAKSRAVLLRSEADELRALPINEAAQLIETKHAAHEQARHDATERARELHDQSQRDARRTDPSREGPRRTL